MQYFTAGFLVLYRWETTELPVAIDQLIFYLVISFLYGLSLTGQTVHSRSSQKLKTGFAMFTGGFSLISWFQILDQVQSQIQAQVQTLSLRFRGRLRIRFRFRRILRIIFLSNLGLERGLILGVDGVHVPSSWGIGEEVRNGDLALFILAFLSSSRGG